MKGYLLDTNIISEIHKPRPHGAVLAWFVGLRDEEVFLSAVTLLELQEGIEKTRKHHPDKAKSLEAWVDELEKSRLVLAMQSECFRETARMMVGRQDELFYDVMIAATARMNGLAVATRNEKDFKDLNVEIINPFKFN